jgi:rod shape-determining protein MreD
VIFLLLLPALAAVLLDLTLAPSLRLFEAQVSFCVAMVAVWGVLRRREETLLLAPLAGLLLGLLGNEPLGTSVLALIPVAALSTRRDPDQPEGRYSAAILAAFMGAAGYVLCVLLIEAAVGRFIPDPLVVLRVTAGGALLTTVLAAVLYWPLVGAAWQPRAPGQFRRY